MSSFLTAAGRRLGLGAVIAAGALALPGPALASVTVQPATTTEGNSGKQSAVTTVELSCGDIALQGVAGYCDYALNFTAGTARGFEDFVWDPPLQVRVPAHQTQHVTMAVEVLGDTTAEHDETYGIDVVEESYVEEGDFGGNTSTFRRVETSTGSYTAGTIINDDRICRYCAGADASVANLVYPSPGP